MVQTANQQLDAEELLHLALAASEKGKSEEAIGLLKRALALAPEDGRLHYLLGAEHAQIGLYDRAAEEMQRAVELEPGLETAHFQLGLLHMTSGRADAAAEAWKPLDKLNKEHFLYLFKTGLLHLVRDEFAECEQYLRRGIAVNRLNAALNNDMARILKDIAPHIASAATAAAPSAKTPGQKHVLISTYKKNRTEDKDKDN